MILGILFDIFQVALSLLDICTDIAVAIEFHNDSRTTFFVLVIVTLCITSVANSICFAMRADILRESNPCSFLVPILLAPFGLLLPPINFIATRCGWDPGNDESSRGIDWEQFGDNLKARNEQSPLGRAAIAMFSGFVEAQNKQLGELDGAISKRFMSYLLMNLQVVTESAPQVVVQLVAISLSGGAVTTLQILSLSLSMLSIVSKSFFLARSFCVPAVAAKMSFCAFDLFSMGLLFSALLSDNIDKNHHLFGSASVKVAGIVAPWIYLVCIAAVIWLFTIVISLVDTMRGERPGEAIKILLICLLGIAVLGAPAVLFFVSLKLVWLVLLAEACSGSERDMPNLSLLHTWLWSGTGKQRTLQYDWKRSVLAAHKFTMEQIEKREADPKIQSQLTQWSTSFDVDIFDAFQKEHPEPVGPEHDYRARVLWRERRGLFVDHYVRNFADDMLAAHAVGLKSARKKKNDNKKISNNNNNNSVVIDDWKLRAYHLVGVTRTLDVLQQQFYHKGYYLYPHLLENGKSQYDDNSDDNPIPRVLWPVEHCLLNREDNNPVPNSLSFFDFCSLRRTFRTASGAGSDNIVYLIFGTFIVTATLVGVYSLAFPFIFVAQILIEKKQFQTMQLITAIASAVALLLSVCLFPAFLRYLATTVLHRLHIDRGVAYVSGLDPGMGLSSLTVTTINSFNALPLGALGAAAVPPAVIPEDALLSAVLPFLTAKHVGLWGAESIEELDGAEKTAFSKGAVDVDGGDGFDDGAAAAAAYSPDAAEPLLMPSTSSGVLDDCYGTQ